MKKFKNMNTISFYIGLVLILLIIVCFLYELLFKKNLEGFYTTSTNPSSTCFDTSNINYLIIESGNTYFEDFDAHNNESSNDSNSTNPNILRDTNEYNCVFKVSL